VLHSKFRYVASEAFRMLDLRRSVGYQRIKQGRLRAQKDGRHLYISAAEIDRYIANDPAPTRAQRRSRHISTVVSTPLTEPADQ